MSDGDMHTTGHASAAGTGAAPPTMIRTTGPTTVTTGGRPPGAGSVVLNVLWLVLAGFSMFLGYILAGVLLC